MEGLGLIFILLILGSFVLGIVQNVIENNRVSKILGDFDVKREQKIIFDRLLAELPYEYRCKRKGCTGINLKVVKEVDLYYCSHCGNERKRINIKKVY